MAFNGVLPCPFQFRLLSHPVPSQYFRFIVSSYRSYFLALVNLISLVFIIHYFLFLLFVVLIILFRSFLIVCCFYYVCLSIFIIYCSY